MYEIKRQKRPAFMGAPEFQRAVDEFHDFHHHGGSRGDQGRLSVLSLLEPFSDQITQALERQFDGLCAYTEVASTDDAPLELVWHRPTANATDLDGRVAHDHYWWQAMNWSNWYHASSELGSTKSFLFPVDGKRTPAPAEAPAKLRISRALDDGLLVDPCRDSPSWWLRFRDDGRVVRREPTAFAADRGETSIRAYGLSSQELVDGRLAAIRSARRQLGDRRQSRIDEGPVGAFLDTLDEVADAALPHRGAVIQVLVRDRLTDRDTPLSADELSWLTDNQPIVLVTELIDAGIGRNYFPRGRRGTLDELLGRASADLAEITKAPHFQQLAGVRRATAAPTPSKQVAAEPVAETIITPSDLITKITIKNFRAIEHVEIKIGIDEVNLADLIGLDGASGATAHELSGRCWKMLLGENGSGKSSVLHALAIALSGDDVAAALDRSGVNWGKLLRWESNGARPNGQVLVEFSSGQQIDLNFDHEKHWFAGLGESSPSMHVNIRGYGAARFRRRARDEAPDTQPDLDQATSIDVDNLLDSGVPIMDAEDWLATLEPREFSVAALTLGDLLGESSFADERTEESTLTELRRITRDETTKEIKVDNESLSQVSDGYRSVVALGCEIMAGIGGLGRGEGGTSDFRLSQGIVLIDEIGAHLHPRWRMQITGRMRRAFPNVQFFVTTHEPLCLRGLGEREVIRVLKYREHGVVLDEVDKAPGRYRVDQLLTSEFFGLDSAIDPLVDRKFRRYYALNRQPKVELSSSELAELATLEAEVNGDALRPVLGYTRRDQLIFEAIDDFLLEDMNGTIAPQDRHEARKKIVTTVADMWREIAPPS